jgi:hypothetical protein
MPRPSYVPARVTLAALVALAACGDVGLLGSLANPLTLELSLAVDSLVPGDLVVSRMVIRNRSDRTVQFHGGGCTFGIEVLLPNGSSVSQRRDGSTVPVACAGYLRAWTIPPRDSLVLSEPWDGRVGVLTAPPFRMLALSPGAYRLRPVIHAEEFDLAGPTTGVTVLPWTYARLVHTYGDLPPLDLVVGGRTAASGVRYGSVSPAGLVPAGAQTVEIRPTGEGTAVARADLFLAEDVGNTVVVREGVGGPEPWSVPDAAGAPDPTKSRLRVIHLAAHAPAIIVYRTQPDRPALTPVMLPFPYGAASPYLLGDAGPWTVLVTKVDGSDTLMHTAPMPIPGGQVRTLFLLDEPGGRLSGALIEP